MEGAGTGVECVMERSCIATEPRNINPQVKMLVYEAVVFICFQEKMFVWRYMDIDCGITTG